MGRIRVLDDAVINKIAAGEVVERPASVVKELVENALDAGAAHVTVEIRGGGKALVRVCDDGCGMARDDALLALARHSTSKISGADDLFSIRTMGFRGEALPSIAAVSRIEIVTKEKGALSGTRFVVEGGRVGEARDIGAPDGTEVVVRDLFFNTPARRKFLKTEATENSHIAASLMAEALARPGTGFTLVADGEEVLEAPPAASPRERIAALFGAELAKDLIPLAGAGGCARVEGFISSPGVTRGNRTAQYFFVNGRPVQDRILSFALADASDGVLPARRHPVAFVFLEIEPHEVDVNVHPAKREVRFRSGGLVRDLVRNAASEALRGTARPAPPPGAFTYESRAREGVVERAPIAAETQEPLPWEKGGDAAVGGAAGGHPGWEAAPGSAHGLRVVGQVKNLYVICEDADGLAVIDQHAAHERILFEKVMRCRGEGKGELQRLLIPAVVNLSAHERALAGEYLDALRSLGIGIEPFGKDALKVDQMPACLGALDPGPLLHDVLAGLAAEGRSRAVREGVAAAVAVKVCRAAVKRRDHLRDEELRRLVDDLMSCETPFTCPHGRPTIIRMSATELDRKFKRT
ncbi:MAG: DNA mismatch repair endonuclease MutL [Chlamydiota bacterium]